MNGPTNTVVAAGGACGHPALSEAEQARRANRPVRDPDPVRNAAYWARIDANVAAAPPLSDEQRAVIRTAFSTLTTRAREAA
ncbi:hypothetical protein PV377_10960 [Streptomyces ipomoeae]|uniref:hypothetical protein n=1 Tax=Streptomyces ipomoeae TaxID=103232 RepID=UPI0029AB8A41|nr:hypothetical protein [Streptomyces ipomoeae]MDX2839491.1 hypothetical protein [Streptomyces ipomoeae]